MMRRSMSARTVGVVLALLAGPVVLAYPGTPATGIPVSTAVDALVMPRSVEELKGDIDRYRQMIDTLADPFFEGRCPGTRGNRLAAEYIEFQYKALGLEPAFKDEKGAAYFQPFEAPMSGKPGSNIKVNVATLAVQGTNGNGPEALEAGADFQPLGYSGNGEVTGPLVFVGYAITNADKGYRSIPEGASLKGKVALVYRFEPMDEKGKSKWSEDRWSFAAGLEPKLRAVAEAGASAIVLANPPGASDERASRMPGLELSGRRAMEIPVVAISNDRLEKLVRAADASHRSAMDLRLLADGLKKDESGVVELPGATLTITTKLERIPTTTWNVGAVLPGVGALAEEYVVIGAHYDHLGYGYIGSRDRAPEGKLHPGADDNASGTAGVLMCAKWLSEAAKKLPAEQARRSILFLNFSAEESGLVGSRWYVNHPIVPIEKHAFMINMDMIGRVRDGKCDIESANSAAGVKEWMQPYLDASGMKYDPKNGTSGRSDHASFDGKKVPVIFFFTGMHKEYHTPADTFDTINPEGAVRVAELASRLLLDVARRPERFVHRRNVKDDSANAGDEKASEAERPEARPTANRVRFGIQPGDYTGDKPGVLVGEVADGTPAAKAGIKADDLLTKWDGKDIESVEAWFPMLMAQKPGDVVKVTLVRGGKEMVVEVTLVARDGGRAPQ